MSNALNRAFMVNQGIADMEASLSATYGYSNAIVFRTEAGGGNRLDWHVIIESSNYFHTDSTYKLAPAGTLGINVNATTSTTALFIKFHSSSLGWLHIQPS